MYEAVKIKKQKSNFTMFLPFFNELAPVKSLYSLGDNEKSLSVLAEAIFMCK